MLEFLKTIVEKRNELPSLVTMVDNMKNIVDLVEKEYSSDHDLKNSMIDVLIQLLQEKKS